MRSWSVVGLVFVVGCSSSPSPVPDAGAPAADAGAVCQPETCASLGLTCGVADDGCDGLLDCGECPCRPFTCAERGVSCGETTDGCGGLLSCGGCAAPLTCGGGGDPYACGCERDEAFCLRLDAECGMLTAPDACGAMRTVDCGRCMGSASCGELGTPNSCRLTDARDGNKYPVTRIGTQLWLARNLNFATPGSYCSVYVIPTSEPCSSFYGRYYDWSVMMGGAAASNSTPSGVQGPCPAGWHVPSSAEFELMANYVTQQEGGTATASSWPIASQLRANAATLSWVAGGAYDGYGLSVFATGVRVPQMSATLLGEAAHFWSASTDGTNPIWFVLGRGDDLQRIANGGPYAASVRCVKD